MFDDGRHVLAIRSQFADLEPNQHVHLGVDVGRARRWQRSKFARTNGLGYGDRRREHTTRGLPYRTFELCVFVQGMLLVVAEYFEYDRMGFDVLDEGFGR